MEKHHLLFLSLLLFVPLLHGGVAVAETNEDGSEEWGYVAVRPKAHMFWWLYRSLNRVHYPSNPWPIILWLQGGPGGSSVGMGNFQEIGPLDTDLKPRNSTWLQLADLLFVDSPVGTGYSFVEDNDTELLVKTDLQAADDLTILLQNLFNINEGLQQSPLYIVAESYGGKFAVTLALSALRAIEAGTLKLKLGGVALGDSWISPEDFVLSWGPLLNYVSRLDNNGLEIANSLAQKIQQQIKDGSYEAATASWGDLENAIDQSSGQVDFYNFLSDASSAAGSTTAARIPQGLAMKKYATYLRATRSLPGGDGSGGDLMNDIIRKKLKIIPENVTFGGQSDAVFSEMGGDFMRPRIDEVDELLAKGVNVTIYNGQLDVICATKGAEAWVEKLKWAGLKNFLIMERSPLFCGNSRVIKGFIRSFQNLHFYWILGAGHFVPVDQPCISLNMVRDITQSPVVLSN